MNASFNVDTAAAGALMGYIDGLATTVSTKKYIDAALDYSASVLSQEFGYAVDEAARLSPQYFHHVYEWGNSYGDKSTVGSPADRLFKLRSIGAGNKRSIAFIFLPSTKPVPVNPILLQEGRTGKSVKEGIHIFTWKAPIMEYGTPVVIRPSVAEALAFVGATGKIRFSKTPVNVIPGKNTMGVFTEFFISWWNTGAAAARFDSVVRPQLQNDLSEETPIKETTSKYRNTKQINISASTSIAFEYGRRSAERNYTRKIGAYKTRARERRDIYGD